MNVAYSTFFSQFLLSIQAFYFSIGCLPSFEGLKAGFRTVICFAIIRSRTAPSIHGALQKSHRCSPKESSVLGKRIDGALQKNHRCSSKESTILFKRSDDAKRKQSIYSQKPLNCYAVGESKILAFPIESIQNPVS